MMERQRVAKIERQGAANAAAWVNAALTLATAIVLGIGVLIGFRPGGSETFGADAADIVIFSLVWCYTLLTPVIAFVTFIFGRRDTRAVRLTLFLIALWFIYVAWTLMLTF
jgi:hypothetical protein